MTTGHVWTPAMMTTFRALHRNGTGSFSDMAKQMSQTFGIEISRNALIGKARRMELPMRKDDRPRKQGPNTIKARPIPRPVAVAAPIEPPPETDAPEEGLSIYQLTGTTCRWPLGRMMDRPPFRYCGNEAPIEASYCDTHSRLSYNHPRKTWE